MPAAYAPIPLPNRGNATPVAMSPPAFAAPVRWTLVVLSWLAFMIASYLAYASLTGASVAGCGVGAANGCDVVLSSSWSKWLGIPVAVLGLACYAALASLSLLFIYRSTAGNRWVTTAFVLLAIVAGGASLWFIGVQVFAIGEYCKYCLATDACGILIGIFAVAAAVQCLLTKRAAPQARGAQSGLIALRSATMPTRAPAPSAATPLPSSPPYLLAAFGGAVPLLLVLIGGQLLFREPTYQMEKVALNSAITLGNVDGTQATTDTSPTTTHIALRVPDPLEGNESPTKDGAEDKPAADGQAGGSKSDQHIASTTTDSASTNGSESKASSPPSEPEGERILKLLGGKLTLDAYQNPLIGSPEAPHVVVEMVSYDCPHCRKMHALMQQALEHYGDQVALLVMPVPMEKDCNELLKKLINEQKADEAASHNGACGTARLACSIAKIDAPSFAKFHDFLMTGKDKPPAMERIIPKAYGMVDRERVRELSRGPEIKKQIDGYVDLYGQLQSRSKDPNKFGLPVQILGDRIMNGSVEKVEDVFKAWEENLGVKPK